MKVYYILLFILLFISKYFFKLQHIFIINYNIHTDILFYFPYSFYIYIQINEIHNNIHNNIRIFLYMPHKTCISSVCKLKINLFTNYHKFNRALMVNNLFLKDRWTIWYFQLNNHLFIIIIFVFLMDFWFFFNHNILKSQSSLFYKFLNRLSQLKVH